MSGEQRDANADEEAEEVVGGGKQERGVVLEEAGVRWEEEERGVGVGARNGAMEVDDGGGSGGDVNGSVVVVRPRFKRPETGL